MSATRNIATFNNSVGPQVRARREPCRRRFAVLFVLLLVASAQTATQLCARDFAYQAVLGRNAGGVYPPWTSVGANHPDAAR